MMIPIVGGGKESSVVAHNAERTVNWYPEIDKRGKSGVILRPMPGARKIGAAGGGPIRGMVLHLDHAYIVSGNEIWMVSANGRISKIGTIRTSAGPVSMASNGIHVMLVDQSSTGWIISGAAEAIEISDVDFGGSKQVAFIDGYFVVNRPGTGSFYISGLYDGFSWDALDYATAEFDPDTLISIAAHREDLWFFGQYTTEPYYNSGDADFPFAKRQGATIHWGCAAPFSVKMVDNELMWISRNRDGWGQIIRSSGYQPQIVSTRALENKMAGYTITNATATTMRWRGHNFYIITFPSDDVTWVWDAESMEWFEWSTYGLGRHLSSDILFATGVHYAGDFRNGNVYILDDNQYTDDGLEIERIRTTRHFSTENKSMFWHNLEIDMERGTGTTIDPGSDPQIQLRVSDDGGRTYTAVPYASMGKIGEYLIRKKFYRLGASRDRVYEIRCTDPAYTAMVAAYAEVSTGAW